MEHQQTLDFHSHPTSHASAGIESAALSASRGLAGSDYMIMEEKDIFNMEPPSPRTTFIVGGVSEDCCTLIVSCIL